jgi:hypothetical protein
MWQDNFNYAIGNRTHDLPSCSAVPEPENLKSGEEEVGEGKGGRERSEEERKEESRKANEQKRRTSRNINANR